MILCRSWDYRRQGRSGCKSGIIGDRADPDANLGLALGFPEDMVDSIEPISKIRKMIEERTYDCSPELVKEVKDIVQKMIGENL